MYNKLSANSKKRNISFEDEPPEKKMISDGDIFIKQLAEQQRNTNINLEEQLSSKNRFYKSTELISLTNYTSGANSLEEFSFVIKHSNDVEKLKSHGLHDKDIELIFDYKNGMEQVRNKHKNMNIDVLKKRLGEIFEKINRTDGDDKKEVVPHDRLKTELILSAKPASVETRLLKFALQNKQTCKEQLPHPMDQIKLLEEQFTSDQSPVNIKKIRRKARCLTKQIEAASSSAKQEPAVNKSASNNDIFNWNSKWDKKESEDNSYILTEKKTFTCKPQNYYTIKDGKIIKIIHTEMDKEVPKNKLSVEEIKQIAKFSNYEKGTPSKILFLKNLKSGATEDDIRNVFGEFLDKILSVRIMKGKMRGQAFVDVVDEESAENILNQCSGIILKNKPVIIQFGKSK
jgi:hypothetical protein